MRVVAADDPAAVVEAMHALDAGGLIAYPGPGRYVLGADALDEDAIRKVLDLRGLPPDRGLPVLVPDLDAARHVARITPAARRLDTVALAGAAIVLLPAAPTAPDALVGPGDAIAIAPAAPGAGHQLASRFGPVTATAARPRGGDPAGLLDAVAAAFGATLSLGLDGGPVPLREPTIVDATGPEARVLKVGALPASSVIPGGRAGD